jgi:hypothetical protein
MFQDIRILPDEVKQEAKQSILAFVEKHRNKMPEYGEAMFYLEEIDQIERLIKYMEQDLPNIDVMLEDFKLFYQQYDARKGLNFKQTFPDIAFMVE